MREKLGKRDAKLVAVTAERADLASQLSGAEAECTSLKKKYDKARAGVKEKEEALRLTRLEVERLGSELRKCTESRDRLELECGSAKETIEELGRKLEICEEELREKRETCEKRGEAMTLLEEAVTASSTRVEEQRSEYAIKHRLVHQLTKELQASLATESRKVARLERELASAQKSAASASAAAAAAGAAGGSGSGGGVGIRPSPPTPTLASSFLSPPPQSISSPSPQAASHHHGGVRAGSSLQGTPKSGIHTSTPQTSSSGGGGDLGDTVKMLGERLRVVLGEAEVSREKVRMLEGIVQTLSVELEEKKRIVKELTSSTGGAAASTSSSSSSSSSATASELNARLETAQGENERLRRDLKTLGLETASLKAKLDVGLGEPKEEVTGSSTPSSSIVGAGGAGNPFG